MRIIAERDGVRSEMAAVFYLGIEPYRGGFRWLVRKFGVVEPVEIGIESYDTEEEARRSGKKSLIAATRLSGSRRVLPADGLREPQPTPLYGVES